MKNNKVSILVVDDDKTTCQYLAQILSSKNWQVDTARDGATALELLAKKPYDAAVLDYRMPGMDGGELCRRILELQPKIRQVFLTGFPTIDTVFPAMEAGGNRVLSKPVDPAELVRTLEEQLSEAGSHEPERNVS